jgi:AbrB family looped-hinge helix DNA binding protein
MQEIIYQTVKISPKGQLVLPKKIREQVKITKNSVLKIGIDPATNKINIKVISDPIAGLKGILKGRGMSSEQVKKEIIDIEKETGNYD